MNTHQSDVVVLGAGPAGSATALFLARCGYEVTLLDRAAFPRDKPCGEYLSPGAVQMLRDEIGVLPQLLHAGAARLERETVVPHDGRAFGGEQRALSCPRVVTDNILRNVAQMAGVTVVEGFAARHVLFDAGRIAGVVGDGPEGQAVYRAAVTVGADGTHSLLARALGLVRPIPRLQRVALVGHFAALTPPPPLPQAGEGESEEAAVVSTTGLPSPACGRGAGGEGLHSVVMHLPADRTDACCGVGAPCGPDGSRNVNIVVPTSEASKMAGRREDYFRERLRRSFPAVWEQVRDAKPIGPLRSVGCFGHHTTRATHDGALLVGDAATFINPFTGEGVFFALRGAQMAAEAIDAAVRVGNVSRSSLQAYDAARNCELLPRYRLCDLVQRVVHSPTLLAFAAERLRKSAPLTDVLLSTVGDVAHPRDLWTWNTLRLALGAR